MTLNDIVPEHLRPREWGQLQIELAAAGWSLAAVAERLRRPAEIASSPGYIVKVMRSMLDENPSIERSKPTTTTPAAARPIRTSNVDGIGRTIPPHHYRSLEQDDPYCQCGLPASNQIHRLPPD